MKFNTPGSVAEVVYWLKQADMPRSSNRALINSLFNGDSPYTDREADDNNINTNVNFLDAPRLAHHARSTFNNAFLKPGHLFTVGLDSGPKFKREKYAREITASINRQLKRSRTFMETKRSTFAQVVLHGVGPTFWEKPSKWCPCPVAIDDFFLPSRTLVSLENLEYFSIFSQYTPSRFYQMTHGSNVDPGWNKEYAAEIWKIYKEENASVLNYDAFQTPEKVQEAFKGDLGYLDSEAVPTINCWNFFHYDAEKGAWFRKIILDSQSAGQMGEKFLYNPKRAFAEDHSEIIHILFADGANVAPFRYHSVRGLGWLLYAVCHLQNRLRCKFTDATFEQMLWYFRVSNPQDRERLDKVDLHHLGVIPEGLSFVTGPERYTPNFGLIEGGLSLNRQTMSENAAAFEQNINDGTGKEMTATEAMARVNSVNALVGSMLNLAYHQEAFFDREICRRFTLPSSEKEVKAFREDMKKAGVPKELLKVERWNVEPERTLGEGNRTLEILIARELMSVRNLLDPGPQRIVLHRFVDAISKDDALANQLVPLEQKQVSDSVHDAQVSAASILMGLPMALKEGVNHTEYVEALLVSMAAVISRIKKTGETATPEEIDGLQNLDAHIRKHIGIIAQDKNEKERVNGYLQALTRFDNEIRGFIQRYLESQQTGQNGQAIGPEEQAKIMATIIGAKTNAKIKEWQAQQKLQQKDAQFQQRLQQQGIQQQVDLAKTDALTAAEIMRQDALNKARALNESSKPQVSVPEGG